MAVLPLSLLVAISLGEVGRALEGEVGREVPWGQRGSSPVFRGRVGSAEEL